MAFNSSLITSVLEECDIDYEVDDDDYVSFSCYNKNFIAFIDSAGVIENCLAICLTSIFEVSPFEKKKYLKLVNKFNEEVPIVKYMLDEGSNCINIDAEISLNSEPDLYEVIPELVKILNAAYGYFFDNINN